MNEIISLRFISLNWKGKIIGYTCVSRRTQSGTAGEKTSQAFQFERGTPHVVQRGVGMK